MPNLKIICFYNRLMASAYDIVNVKAKCQKVK